LLQFLLMVQRDIAIGDISKQLLEQALGALP